MYDRCLYFNLSTLNRRVTKIWQDEFGLLGLSPSHGYLLVAMHDKPTATQKELSQIMELDASTITRFIDVLTTKKMIKKTSRGKGATFALTESGIVLSEKISLLMSDLFSTMQNTLGEKKLTNIVDSIQQTKQILEENTDETAL